MTDDADDRIREIERLFAVKGKRFRVRAEDNGTWTASYWSAGPLPTAQATSSWNRPTKLAAAEAAFAHIAD